MAYDEQRVTYHTPAPFFNQPRGLDTGFTQEELTTLSREASAREMAWLRDMNRAAGVTLTPELKQPVLPEDFAQQVESLDRKIYERGIAVDREKLVSLGKQCFDELLAADRTARTERVIGTHCDLTCWPSVCYFFAQGGAILQVPVPRRTATEQLTGAGAERDEVHKVEGFFDLWKFYGSEPRAVRYVYSFHDQFVRLAFGQSLFTWIEDSGRVHCQFFCGSSGDKIRYFEAWLPALHGTHHRVKITNALQSVVFWLAGEKSAPPDAPELARDWFGVRLPSAEQLTLAAAVLEGFLLNHKDWNLWQHVGLVTRKPPDRFALNTWSDQLRKRFRCIDIFHGEIAGYFNRPITDHFEFEPARHRAFVNATFDQLRNCVSAVAALTIEENSPVDAAPVAARFRDWILCASKPKAQLVERVIDKLNAAFPGAAFNVEIES
jgi:hypothetical protein